MNISTVSAQTPTSSTATANSLDADDFLSLLMAQLQNQDPTNPMDTQSMVTQLSTIQMVAENRAARESQEFTQATSLLGRQVTWQSADTGANVTAPVTGVVRDGGQTRLTVGSSTITLSQVLSVSA
ncbi:MAG: flagellar hook capping FlgD N-terminal domain-containing protein [Armatimonadota bacterium]